MTVRIPIQWAFASAAAWATKIACRGAFEPKSGRVLPERRVGRDRRGNVRLRRIIECRSRPGDGHAANRRMVRGFLRWVVSRQVV